MCRQRHYQREKYLSEREVSNMPRATRLGDIGSGHDACGSRELVTASDNVFINGKGAARIGDAYQSHGCIEHPPHVGHLAAGSATVYINGRRAGRVGDAIDCGGSAAQGSPNVFIGD